ncbi:MAG: hypothetical protein WC781_00700 [Candidatus Pacearchaeota archaeon]|jgi:hypothetical protein
MSKKNRKPSHVHKNKYEEFSRVKEMFGKISSGREDDKKKGYSSKNETKDYLSSERKYYISPRHYREELKTDFY